METPATPPETPAAAPWRRLLASPAARVAAVAVVLLAAQWLDTRSRINDLQIELARRLADGDSVAKDSRNLARQSQETIATLQAKIALLEARMAETQNQAVTLEAMYQELSRGRDERVLAEVEQAVSIAVQQLQFAGNIETALIALEGADARLARANNPQFVSLRKLIARDVTRLKATPAADVTGLSLKIESVVAAVDSLPLAFEQRPKSDAKEAAKVSPGKTAPPARWLTFASEWWHDLRDLVRVERIDRGDPALLTPTQSFFVRENIKLRLLNARLALLQRDGKTFAEEIRQARELLDRYFDTRVRGGQTAQATLQTLAATDVSLNVPGLGETLATVRNLKLPREKAR